MALQIWLPLNGNLNNQGLADITATNNGATVDNNGKIGKCYSFNGVNKYIVINNFDMSELAEYSISCWVKPNGDDISYLFLVRSGGTHQIRISSDGFTFRDTKNSTLRTVAFGEGFTDGQWTHICCVYIRGEIYLYQNGIQTAHSDTYYHADGQSNSNNTEIRIGLMQSSAGYSYFSGCVNDFRIYDHALSPLEVKELSKGLVLHLPLDRGGFGQSNFVIDSGPEYISPPTKEGSNSSFSKMYYLDDAGKAAATEGAILTISFDYEIYGATAGYIYAQLNGSQILPAGGQNIELVSEKPSGRYVKKVQVSETQASYTNNTFWVRARLYGSSVYGFPETGAYFRIRNVKLELGDKATAWCPNEADDLYSQMGLDNNIEYDVSGYGHNGTKVGTITYDSDTPRYNTSAYFNGSSYFTATSLPSETKTISFWIKATITSSSVVAFADYGSKIAFGFYSGNSLIVHCGSSNGSTGSRVLLGTNIWKTDDWNHVVIVKTGTGTYTTYLNNTVLTPNSANFWTHSSDNFMIGRRSSGSYFTGYLSDLRAYTTCLNESDVRELYNTSMSLSDNGLLFGYEFIG